MKIQELFKWRTRKCAGLSVALFPQTDKFQDTDSPLYGSPLTAHPPSPQRLWRAGRSLSCSDGSRLTAHRSPSKSYRSPLTAHRSLIKGFTILELLVVISIIAILVGLIIPTFSKAREKAKAAKAKVTVKGLEMACNEYLNQYKRWPVDGAAEGTAYEVQDNFYKVLRGDDVAPGNPGRIAFFDFEKPPTAATADTNTCYDPWSYDRSGDTVLKPYYVMFDVDLDNKISIGGQDVYKSVVVWSVGADRTNSTTDDVKSWE